MLSAAVAGAVFTSPPPSSILAAIRAVSKGNPGQCPLRGAGGGKGNSSQPGGKGHPAQCARRGVGGGKGSPGQCTQGGGQGQPRSVRAVADP